MNAHDIKLPPLPSGYAPEVAAAMRNYARTAIEADRKRRGEPVAWTTPDGREPISDAVKESRLDLYEKNYTVPLYTAPQPRQIPEGYKLVPIEPTEEMIEAGCALYDVSLRQRYHAMLEVAPEVKPAITPA